MARRGARCAVAAGVMALGSSCAPVTGGRYAPAESELQARRGEIVMMLARGAASWNHGDLDTFVDDYLPGNATTYIGSRGTVRGPEAIRAAYAPRFAPGAVRDSLSFELVDVDAIAPDVLNVIATYILARRVGGRDSVTARGPTSLVMRRVDGRWRIVHDHSS